MTQPVPSNGRQSGSVPLNMSKVPCCVQCSLSNTDCLHNNINWRLPNRVNCLKAAAETLAAEYFDDVESFALILRITVALHPYLSYTVRLKHSLCPKHRMLREEPTNQWQLKFWGNSKMAKVVSVRQNWLWIRFHLILTIFNFFDNFMAIG